MYLQQCHRNILWGQWAFAILRNQERNWTKLTFAKTSGASRFGSCSRFWRANWQGLRARGVVCVCFNQLLLFCFVVSFWSNRICSPWRSLQEPADQRGELSAKGTLEWPNPHVLYVSTRQSKCTRHWGSRQKRATCFATVLQNLRVLPLRNEPNLSCNISGCCRWRKVVAESRD